MVFECIMRDMAQVESRHVWSEEAIKQQLNIHSVCLCQTNANEQRRNSTPPFPVRSRDRRHGWILGLGRAEAWTQVTPPLSPWSQSQPLVVVVGSEWASQVQSVLSWPLTPPGRLQAWGQMWSWPRPRCLLLNLKPSPLQALDFLRVNACNVTTTTVCSSA